MEIEIKPLTANIEVVVGDGIAADQLIALQNQIADLKVEKERLENLMRALQADNAELQAEIIQADNKINRLTEELNSANEGKEALQLEINELQAQVAELRNDLDALNNEYKAVVAELEAVTAQITRFSTDWDALNGEEVENASAYALETKNVIAEAITNKGGIITPETTFRAYADEINNFSVKKTGDPHTLLLMHFTESATKDDSINDCQFTVTGNPTITTEKSKFGGGSLYLDGASCLTFERNYFPFFTPEFTFEFWWYPPDDFSSSSRFCLFSQHGTFPKDYNGTAGECFNHVEFYNNRYYQEGTYSFSRGRDYTYGLTTYGLNLKQWNHIAIVRDYREATSEKNQRLHVNGKQISWQVATNARYHLTATWDNFPAPWTLFAFKWESGSVARYLKGYINDLRISDVARYSATSFTPPTEPFTI